VIDIPEPGRTPDDPDNPEPDDPEEDARRQAILADRYFLGGSDLGDVEVMRGARR
jgi:hypothetical protein